MKASKASIASKKILIITYYWPPCGGAGVQRWLKFTKYMPEYGWELHVLTVDPAFAEYPARDESLEKDIHPGIRVYKTKALNYFRLGKTHPSSGPKTRPLTDGKNTINNRIAHCIRGNFFIPDPRKGWNRFAVQKAARIIREHGIRYVLTTSPPHSTQLIGLKLKKMFPELKWIADLRDPWTDIYYYKNFYGTWPAKRYDRKLEENVLHKADKIITVGESLADLFSDKLHHKTKDISVITNGYDEDDFRNMQANVVPGKTMITYVGSITDQYPLREFIDVINDLSISGRHNELSMRIAGHVSHNMKTLINDYPVSRFINIIPYTNHRQSIKYMLESNMLLLLIPDHPLNKLIITGKIFEYLRTGKPILAIGPPEGDAAKIIREMKAGATFEKDDAESIKNFILDNRNDGKINIDTSIYSHGSIVRDLTKTIK